MDFFDEDHAAVIQQSRQYLLKESADGSDAGLCIGRHSAATAADIAFGQSAEVRVLTQAVAHAEALACGFYLEGLTGTHQGVIGAFRPAGLSVPTETVQAVPAPLRVAAWLLPRSPGLTKLLPLSEVYCGCHRPGGRHHQRCGHAERGPQRTGPGHRHD